MQQQLGEEASRYLLWALLWAYSLPMLANLSRVYTCGAVRCIDKDGGHNNCNVEDYIDATSKWNWEPAASHPCNFQRMSRRTLHELFW